jgi:DNA-binding transcriptional ArsR family regulator
VDSNVAVLLSKQGKGYFVLTRLFQFLVRARALMAGDADRYYIYLAILTASSVDARREGLDYNAPSWGDQGVGAMSISEMTGIPRQTVRRKLDVLERSGLISSAEDGTYHLIQRVDDLDIVNEVASYFRT